MPKNITADKVFMSKMLAYSARKNSAKGPPAYSTLKPETSSDSPSVRSKGARLVSARVETNHIIARGHVGRISQMPSCVLLNVWRENPPESITKLNTINPKLTSYEMVWAMARRAPIRAYFELEDQPEPIIENTAVLERMRTTRMLRLRSAAGRGRGIGAHRISARERARIGVKINIRGEDVEGRIGSLINNLIPSAMGCRRPTGPTKLGPLRAWAYPNTFRSRSVKKATATSTGTIKEIEVIRD